MSCVIPAGFRVLPLPVLQLSLAAVLKCGQSFRWHALPLHSYPDPLQCHEYRFCLKDRVICLRQNQEHLYYRSVFPPVADNDASTSNTEAAREKETLAFLRDYFQLDVDLQELYDDWSRRDAVFCSFRERFSGIRMLRQDPWENVVSFICSANNNISRISKMVHNLCTHFSPPLVTLEALADESASESEPIAHTYHPFPPPSALAHQSVGPKLRKLGFGYRAEYIQKTAAVLLETHGTDEGVHAYLASLRQLPTEESRAELLKLMGIGRKVADCVLLMSLDKTEVIPVDTHVHQIAMKHYGMRCGSKSLNGKVPMTPKIYDEVNAKLFNIWGPYAGWAHSVLFTADLKSFSNFGLPTPSPSVTPSKRSSSDAEIEDYFATVEEKVAILTSPSTPATPSLSKRKRTTKVVVETVNATLEVIQKEEVAGRAARRRRSTRGVP